MTSRFLKKFGIGIALLAGVFIVLGVILNIAVTVMEHRDGVLSAAASIDGFGSYFTGIRLAIVVLIIFYWKEMVSWAGQRFKFNHRQKFLLRALYPYMVGFLLVIEILGVAF